MYLHPGFSDLLKQIKSRPKLGGKRKSEENARPEWFRAKSEGSCKKRGFNLDSLSVEESTLKWSRELKGELE